MSRDRLEAWPGGVAEARDPGSRVVGLRVEMLGQAMGLQDESSRRCAG